MAEVNPIEKAIRESMDQIAAAKTATRKRNLWAYIRADELEKWAKNRGIVGDTEHKMRTYFQRSIRDPDNAHVTSGHDHSGNLLHAVYVGIAWRVVCPDGGHRRTADIPDLELANRALTAPCTEIDLDADTQTPCPGGDHTLEKLPPLTDPTF
jgi:hypothetical protein